MIGDQLVPIPVSEPLEEGEGYFTPSLYNNKAVGYNTWRDTAHDRTCLKAGLIHLSTEAAIAHGEALVALSKKTDRTVTTELKPKHMRALKRAVDEAASWRGALVGYPDPEPLREFDTFISTAREALEIIKRESSKKRTEP